jgi:uncharacterized protein YbcV (DUF1398 family)
MKPESARVLIECSQGALSGELTFPEIVERLEEIGVERYHADYTRQEITYYFEDGDSLVVPCLPAAQDIAMEFSVDDIAEAVRQSQQNEHSFVDFLHKTMAAGCVGYFVQITGRRVLYFGRQGEVHTEHFPIPSEEIEPGE